MTVAENSDPLSDDSASGIPPYLASDQPFWRDP